MTLQLHFICATKGCHSVKIKIHWFLSLKRELTRYVSDTFFYNIFCFSQVMLSPLNLFPLNVYYYLEMTNFHHSFPEQRKETHYGWAGSWKMNLGCHCRLKLALELSSLTDFTSVVILKVWAWIWGGLWDLSEGPVEKRFL